MLKEIFEKYGEEQFRQTADRYFQYRNKFGKYFLEKDEFQFFTQNIGDFADADLMDLADGRVALENFSDFLIGYSAAHNIKNAVFLSKHGDAYEKADKKKSIQNLIDFGREVREFLDQEMPETATDPRPRLRPISKRPEEAAVSPAHFEDDHSTANTPPNP